MTSLLSLPTEIIIQILASCPTAYTAVSLSSVNTEIHAIWLKHIRQILESIARSIPAYEDATDLTNLQYTFEEQPTTDAVGSAQPLALLHFRRLLSNAALAAEATAGWPDTWQHKHSYYLVRKLVLAYLHQDEKLKRALFLTLSTAPIPTPYVAYKICNFLCCDARYDHLGVIHCIPSIDGKIVPTHYLLQAGGCRPEWQYAHEVTKSATMSTTRSLEDAMFNSTYS